MRRGLRRRPALNSSGLGARPSAASRFSPAGHGRSASSPSARIAAKVRHVGSFQSGAMHVVHDDGTEEDLGPGEAYVIEPGHNAWVVGDEPFVGFEFESRSAEEYARE